MGHTIFIIPILRLQQFNPPLHFLFTLFAFRCLSALFVCSEQILRYSIPAFSSTLFNIESSIVNHFLININFWKRLPFSIRFISTMYLAVILKYEILELSPFYYFPIVISGFAHDSTLFFVYLIVFSYSFELFKEPFWVSYEHIFNQFLRDSFKFLGMVVPPLFIVHLLNQFYFDVPLSS